MTAPTIEIGTEARELAERVKVAAGERYWQMYFECFFSLEHPSRNWRVKFDWVLSYADPDDPGTSEAFDATPLASLRSAIAKSPWAGEVL